MIDGWDHSQKSSFVSSSMLNSRSDCTVVSTESLLTFICGVTSVVDASFSSAGVSSSLLSFSGF